MDFSDVSELWFGGDMSPPNQSCNISHQSMAVHMATLRRGGNHKI